ncbi:probable glucan endo-1,3-beta-glucosidase A6 [Oryza brachyantha]|uniref:probable glucan endo-1,3-beta-glucosidase A6 n=1 Tax=Oryza brachyantha TaxID=4533 RepID=UPI001ADA1391|nr:probable glucan endo-1,3-beta-glucosidase A6 [Oryza brachyantha]
MAVPATVWALLLLAAFSCCHVVANGRSAAHGVGVNYGRVADDIPPPRRSVELLRAVGAGSVKIYDGNSSVLRALAGTGMRVSIMVPNEIIPGLAASAAAADRWVAENLVPYYPETRVKYLLVGNELLSDYSIANSTWPRIVPAMENLHASLRRRRISSVKISTTLAMDALSSGSFPRPPSAAEFRPDIAGAVVRPLLRFLNGTNSYYFVDAYPYFVWAGNNETVPLEYALFQGGGRYVDPGTGLTYTNMLDEMLDAVVVAMAKLGYGGVKLGIAETGWPNGGDYEQIGGNVHNAAIYNRNLAARMAKNPGTPARPGAKMPVFVFSLYNEDLKPGPGTERHWGLYYANGTAVYPIDLTGARPLWSYPPLPPPENDTPYKGPVWCVLADRGGKLNLTAVGDALAYACGQGNGTCATIQPGRECFQPNTTAAHASYAFNSYWQQLRKNGATCYFNNLAEETTKDPSHGSCKFHSSLD